MNRILQPGTLHSAITLSEVGSDLPVATVIGGHFYPMSTMHLTLMAKFREALWPNAVTNSEHPMSEAYLHWMGFHMAETYDKYWLPDAVLADRTKLRDTTGGGWNGTLQTNCLCYILLCAESLTAPLPNGDLPDFPQSFLDQRHNARVYAYEYVTKIKAEDGFPWKSWKQLVAEMDDRIINRDDITSPFRKLVDEARNLNGNPNEDNPPTIFDPRFKPALQQFYLESEHATITNPDHPTGPKKLPPWSNISEGTIIYQDGSVSGPAGNVVRPDWYQSRWGAWTDPFLPLSGRGQTDNPEELSNMDQSTLCVINKGEELDKLLSAKLAHNPKWLTKKSGGRIDDVDRYWIGCLRKK